MTPGLERRLGRTDRDRFSRRASTIGVALLLGTLVNAGSLVGCGRAATTGTVSREDFATVRVGMSTAQVRTAIGDPSTRTAGPAEGLRREPMVSCWHYLEVGLIDGFSVCFLDGKVATRGAYVLTTGGSP